ncbi:hypothetical protein COX03_03625 [Candidatus Woesebacteria bacterium CG22_combo_CG10-13_8_21_14_all_39_10]|uniref:Type 4 fimbrial biogenesis protein PilX N-terminal domain-containing protein n=1 Tax=Candidatus Woesebacteria bacterium CG22_combo_CG10-13_8_21_14_all_39_10 TaxID=1975059 RepID=A0A2H0BJZ6_9BACT|nr:MAG: hypothetical protein COX03_03625 [Candidatus Woesebacteria bacterium CG22_combo_CG10-13_8_21_14_all_39_10]
MKYLPRKESGQALLLVLLSMSVVLTIVLSILARSTVDIGVSSRSEESVRAFSAAEAGIEQALVAGPLSGTLANDATFDAKVTDFSSAVTEFVLPSSLYSGESATVWFVSHDADGNLSCADGNCFKGKRIKVCWGKENTPDNTDKTPAIEVSIIYLTSPGVYTTAQIARAVVDPNDSRNNTNKFSDDDGGICTLGDQSFAFNKTISFGGGGGFKISPASIYMNVNGLQLARISFLYNTEGHPVYVKVFPVGGSSLPAQGVAINSSGVSGSSTRKVEVIRGFKELPGIFENAVFSQEGITK